MELKIKLDIPERLYNELIEFCEVNDIKLEEFINKSVSDTYYTLKYGDINEKIDRMKNVDAKETITSQENQNKETIIKQVVRKENKNNDRKECDENNVKNEILNKTVHTRRLKTK